MPEVIFPGPDGRLEGRYQPPKVKNAPIALVLHPHPKFGGTMNNKVVYHLFHAFARRGFAVLRFNFRGVGRSAGAFDEGAGETEDFRAALDYMAARYPGVPLWAAGFSFGAWIALETGASDERVSVAEPPTTGTVPIGVPPSRNVTVPVGTPEDGASGVIVAARVRAWPNPVDGADATSVTDPGRRLTSWMIQPKDDTKLASPE